MKMRIKSGRYVDRGLGGRNPGYRVSDETKRKISESLSKNKRRYIKLGRIHGQEFFDEWDRVHGLPALSIQNSEIRNNVVSRRSNQNTYPRVEISGDTIFVNPLDTTSPDKLTRADSKLFLKTLTPLPLPALVATNSLKQHHANRGSISRHMITPLGSVSLTFPTPPPIQEKSQSSKMTEVPIWQSQEAPDRIIPSLKDE